MGERDDRQIEPYKLPFSNINASNILATNRHLNNYINEIGNSKLVVDLNGRDISGEGLAWLIDRQNGTRRPIHLTNISEKLKGYLEITKLNTVFGSVDMEGSETTRGNSSL